MKKIFTVVLIVAFIMSSLGTVSFASDYQGHWAEDVIGKFIENKIISGDEQGNVNPDVNIKRCEFVKIINRFFEYTEKADVNFNDVTSDKWYADEFLTAKKAGYITGDQNGNANPEQPITRAEVCVILSRILNLPVAENTLPQGEDIPDWAKQAVNSVFKAGYIKGYEDGSLRVLANIKRAEAVSIISRCEADKAHGESESMPPASDSTPVNNMGNVTGMGSGGGSVGIGSGGGGSSAPVGSTPARIDIRNFDEKTFELDLTAYYIDEFVFKLEVGEEDPFIYDEDDISPTKVSSGYTFNMYDIILKTVIESGSNDEIYKIYVTGLASGNRKDVEDIKVYEGKIVIDVPVPSGLNAAYNTDGTTYNKNEYKLSWDVVDTASEYQWKLYNSSEENATPVTSGVITAQSLEANATVVSMVTAIDSEWGERENLYFTVSAKDKETTIWSEPAEPKYLLFDAPKVTGVTYEGNDVYKIVYEKDLGANYEVTIGSTVLTDGTTYIPADADKVMTIKVKGDYGYNETKASSYSYDFSYSGGDGDKNAPYIISSPRQFKNIADNPDKNFILGCDIEFEDVYNGISNFSGILDGSGYTVDLGTGATQGVFTTASNFTIKNLTVKGAINSTTKEGAGAFVSASKGTATFINCKNFANVTSKSGSAYVGGILGNGFDGATASTFENCVNYGTVDVNGNTNNNSNGGIIGVGRNTTIKTSVNYGIINGQRYAGGLIGWSTSTLEVLNCANFGNIFSQGNNINYVGGVAGYLSSSPTGSIKNFFNAGQVKYGIASFTGLSSNPLSISYCVNVGATDYPMTSLAGATTSSCYFLEGTGSDSTGAKVLSSDELKALTLDGYALQNDYDYPLPSGIVYLAKEEANAVTISTAAEFMDIVNDLSGSYKLTKDIDLSNCGYVAISDFKGVLNGSEYSINLGNSATQGLFATVSNATIKNLTVKGSINATKNVGAFAGAATGTATFINCKNYANVTSPNGGQYVGGILGNGFDGCTAVTFENCVNYGEINTSGNGNNSSTSGILGVGRSATIKNCMNYGTIKGQDNSGGLVGWCTATIEVSNCANFGAISIPSVTDRENNVGGAVGKLGNATGSIKNFFNAGQVNCGVVGIYGGSSSISNCVNVGASVYAVVGSGNVTPTNCYYLQGSATNSTGAEVLTSDELKELNIDGYAIQNGYDYPLPTGIIYSPLAVGELS